MSDDVLGIIAPHPPIMVAEVGGPRAEVTRASAQAMRAAARALEEFAPDTIVLMSPHAPTVSDAFVIDDSARLAGDLGDFGARGMRLTPTGDPALAGAIITEALAEGIPVLPRSGSPLLAPGELDHGALVPLSFLDRASRYPLVEISLAFLPLAMHRRLGNAVRRAASNLGRRVAFVASGDCSHRLTPDAPAGYSSRGAEFDAALVRILKDGDYAPLEELDRALIEAAGECGLRSFITLGGFLEGSGAVTDVVAYEGPWGVGYLTAVAAPPALAGPASTPPAGRKGGMPHQAESEPVTLARQTIETYVRERRMIGVTVAPGLMSTQHGAFVSLHREGFLRGCIGTISPTKPTLAEEIVHNAIQAATEDPRFPPVAAEELGDLEISVDVLHEPEPATLDDLDPRTYGVIVSCDWRRGLLLPDLEGVDCVSDQVRIACQKAGIGEHERIRLERFRVDRYH